jgi:GT2 family glycosyltransferase
MNSNNILVSIIIPNYNGQKLLSKYLPKVIKAAQGNEIIVVDDASPNNDVEYLQKNFQSVKVIPLKTNQRFAAACNAGVEQAAGEIVVLLNSDVEPTEHFLKPLVAPFSDPKVFAVGCAEINPFEDMAKINGRAGGAYKRGLIIHWRCKDQTKSSTLWVSGGSGAFRKSIWQELGGMDTMFKPAYEEDRDICYRGIKRGYRVLFCPESLVYHNHETTNKVALGINQMKVASFKNHLLLVWKNITDPFLFAKHLFWLPYHLILTSIRSNGYFLRGFFAAIKQLPEAMNKRQIEKRESTVSDAKVLASFQE